MYVLFCSLFWDLQVEALYTGTETKTKRLKIENVCFCFQFSLFHISGHILFALMDCTRQTNAFRTYDKSFSLICLLHQEQFSRMVSYVSASYIPSLSLSLLQVSLKNFAICVCLSEFLSVYSIYYDSFIYEWQSTDASPDLIIKHKSCKDQTCLEPSNFLALIFSYSLRTFAALSQLSLLSILTVGLSLRTLTMTILHRTVGA